MIIGKIKSKYIARDVRFNSGYFLNEDAINSRLLEENSEKCVLLKNIATVWNPPIFKRQFCKNTERAVPYCQSSDVTNALEGSEIYINKEQAIKVGAIVEENQILVTGFGTIGNTRLINELSAGISYANNCCRIQANDDELYGYVYAVISSKYGRSQLNKNASGSVVRYIEAPGIKKTWIPRLTKPKQQEIHNLIVEASELRVEANKLLREAIDYFEKTIEVSNVHLKYQFDSVSSQILNNGKQKRLDGQFQLLWKILNKEKKAELSYVKIRALASSIFVGGRGKRNYVEKGVPFLSSSEMMLFNPKRGCKNVSKTNPGLDVMMVSKKDILISRSGTVGNTVLVGDDLNDTAISEHALRLVIDQQKISPSYVFCFLNTTFGKKCMEASSFGSVIITLNEELIGDIEIPLLDDSYQVKITELVDRYLSKMDQSTIKENQAIDLVVKEIESWQE